MKVVGVDGAGRANGWVAVVVEDDHLHSIRLHPSLASVLSAEPDARVIGIDMPIGHEAARPDGRRACDAAARDFLGLSRGRSVFWVPPPTVLAAVDVTAAHKLADEHQWTRPSPLVWALRHRIQEAADAAHDPRVIEVHPEVSFQQLLREHGTGQHLRFPKDTWDGLVERLDLLHHAHLRPTRSFGGLGRASPDDVLDATAAAWTARRHGRSESLSLPAPAPTDPVTGRPVAIWC